VGLRDGIRLLNELCERFWDQLHPGFEPEGIDLDTRAMPLNRLGSDVAAAAACALFTGTDPREASRPRTFRWSDFQNSSLVDARATGQNAAGAKALLEQGYITGEEWHARIKSADPVHLAAVVAQLDECLAALGELRVQNEKHFGANAAPSLIPLADVLAEMREHVQKQLSRGRRGTSRTALGGRRPSSDGGAPRPRRPGAADREEPPARAGRRVLPEERAPASQHLVGAQLLEPPLVDVLRGCSTRTPSPRYGYWE
jgi:hypothetical protein